ncbi:MAG: PIN domain-containing protein [Pseudomonadota bacterium]|nr:PIN domain-containing protein [Pseudomonadota bacterium]
MIIVLDTNVLVSALRSRRGASFRLLSLVGTGRFDLALSVPLILEYEAVADRMLADLAVSAGDLSDILDYLCSVAIHRPIFFLWRPTLPDPKDDMVLELAVDAGAPVIVTFNLRDFVGVDRFGVRALTPREYLQEIGEVL